MTTKDQIEAACVYACEDWKHDMNLRNPTALTTSCEVSAFDDGFERGAIWMQAEMQKLKEQWQREAFLAATEGPCDDEGRFSPDYESFEDWRKQNERQD